MKAALKAGVAYFAVVFAFGFLLGTVRVLGLAPRLGETGAVLIELPIILLISWFVCIWLLDRFAVPQQPAPRATMGAAAFALLMAAELGVSLLVLGRTDTGHLATYQSWSTALGLAAQLGFAAFPLLQMKRIPAG